MGTWLKKCMAMKCSSITLTTVIKRLIIRKIYTLTQEQLDHLPEAYL